MADSDSNFRFGGKTKGKAAGSVPKTILNSSNGNLPLSVNSSINKSN